MHNIIGYFLDDVTPHHNNMYFSFTALLQDKKKHFEIFFLSIGRFPSFFFSSLGMLSEPFLFLTMFLIVVCKVVKHDIWRAEGNTARDILDFSIRDQILSPVAF